MMIKFKMLILRILIYPLILIMMIITYNYAVIERSIMFLIHGGEWINYHKDDKKTIEDIYKALKKQ